MRRHIVVICPGLAGGGSVAKVAFKQAEGIAEAADVTLVTDTPLEDKPAGLRVIAMDTPEFKWLRRFSHVPREVAFAMGSKSACRKLHRSQNIDAIICHGHVPATIAAVPMWKEFGIPYAIVTHGDIFDRPKGTYDRRLTWLYQLVTPRAYRNAALVVALSPHMQQLAISSGAKPSTTIVLPNGIDPSELHLSGMSSSAPLRQGEPIAILYVGRLSVEKGVDLLINALALLKEDHVPFSLKVVGEGAERPALEALVASLNLDACVEFVGSVPRASLGRLYEASHVVCVPSRSDALPTVVLEAMAAGVVVVGADAGGIPFLVKHEVTGIVCDRESPRALAQALAHLASHPDEARAMGEAARHRALSEFNWERTSAALRDALFAVCDDRQTKEAEVKR